MLVKTDFVKSSGEGTPLFSKAGALNRFKYLSFLDRTFEF
jgi:hypothetical protein